MNGPSRASVTEDYPHTLLTEKPGTRDELHSEESHLQRAAPEMAEAEDGRGPGTRDDVDA